MRKHAQMTSQSEPI